MMLERAERFTALENFRHIAAGLKGERHEKRNHSSHNNNRESHLGRPQNVQDRRNKTKGFNTGRKYINKARRLALRTFA